MPDARRITPPRSPQHLQDVSHLFLSTAVSAPGPARSEAIVLLACDEGGPWRAYAAAGLAKALEAAGIDVTLLEAGRSLPNVGYYFGLESSLYLRPVLDPGAVVSARIGETLRFYSARDPGLLPAAPCDGAMSDKPRIVVFGFDRSAGGADGSIPSRAYEIAVDTAAGTAAENGRPDAGANGGAGGARSRLAALVTVGPERSGGYLGAVRRRFRERFPAAPVLSFGAGDLGEARGRREVGSEKAANFFCAARRAPPAPKIFCGLASALLQRLAARKEARR